MANPALTYALETVGVDRVHDEARAHRDKLDGLYTELSTAKDAKRDLEFRLHDREMEVASDERGKHPDMSAAAMEKHLKVALARDDDYRSLREQLSKVIGDIDGLEYDVRLTETDIKIAVGRLQELGGYFNYLAAIKQAETAKKQTEASTAERSGSPWE